eukprot:CAMPEP_0198277300 /NCGR_PEP_ID=MMETSP1447-20131203/65779_1 /TAXON_ID=420782 /ORGANISM="Chaetoceros dichaeta, Strain CCMP1751" /LENGTH=330 /DNA_ID=CAMNT_0043972315 /DNA_START=36 /DNA_END=1029 /DNA_ORIENTATION=-
MDVAASTTTNSNKLIEKVLAWIYNRMIVDMTEVWYRAVLERQKPGSTILDVGVGTAGALLRCQDIILSKKLHIIGIDYNPFYITAAHQSIQDAGPTLAKYVQVHHCDLYNRTQLDALLLDAVGDDDDDVVTTVYFSGSFSLLPNPSEALKIAASILMVGVGKVEEEKQSIDGITDEGGDGDDDDDGQNDAAKNETDDKRGSGDGRDGDDDDDDGQNDAAKNDSDDKRGNGDGRDGDRDGDGTDAKIYITQTYQRHSPPFLSIIKPLIKYVTTVDFGQLVREEDVLDILKQDGVADVLEVAEHGVLDGSVDNYWQAAYLSVLNVKRQKEND